SHLPDALRAYAREAESVDRWVRTVGQNFLWADQSGVIVGADAVGVGDVDLGSFIGEGMSRLDTVKTALGGLIMATSVRTGATYPGQIRLVVPQFFKSLGVSPSAARTWAGLSPYLTHIKWTNLPGHMAKGGAWATIPVVILGHGDSRMPAGIDWEQAATG
ncbi:MAG: hypothetical protein WCO99_09860, partial [Planctomycetota bacterium]